jgi:ribosomal protein RSM22 (predicted rRNA methylase)
MPTELAALKEAIKDHKDEFEKMLGEIRRKTDERHQENGRRFDALERAISEHAQSDLTALATLHSEMERNTAATAECVRLAAETRRDVKDLKVVLEVGRGTALFAKMVASVMKWVGTVAVGVAALYGFYLWLTGRSPFPPTLP